VFWLEKAVAANNGEAMVMFFLEIVFSKFCIRLFIDTSIIY